MSRQSNHLHYLKDASGKSDTSVILLDGEEHRVGDPGCCSEEACPCGGLMHYQPTYGGYCYRCDLCGRWS